MSVLLFSSTEAEFMQLNEILAIIPNYCSQIKKKAAVYLMTVATVAALDTFINIFFIC